MPKTIYKNKSSGLSVPKKLKGYLISIIGIGNITFGNHILPCILQ